MSTKKHDVSEELLSGLLANYKKPEDLIGENGLLKQLTKLLVERALDAELTEHLGHERNEAVVLMHFQSWAISGRVHVEI